MLVLLLGLPLIPRAVASMLAKYLGLKGTRRDPKGFLPMLEPMPGNPTNGFLEGPPTLKMLDLELSGIAKLEADMGDRLLEPPPELGIGFEGYGLELDPMLGMPPMLDPPPL